jgi:hypothetical protein
MDREDDNFRHHQGCQKITISASCLRTKKVLSNEPNDISKACVWFSAEICSISLV